MHSKRHILNIPLLHEKCLNTAVAVQIFTFIFNSLEVDAIYSNNCSNLLLTVKTLKVAWFTNISISGQINTFIPKDKFLVLKDYFCPIVQFNVTKHSTDTFFDALVQASNNPNCYRSTSAREISNIVSYTTTNDRRYDNDSPDKPFFFGFRRNCCRRVTEENLSKTRLHFGQEITKYCRTNNISTVWTATPSCTYANLLLDKNALKRSLATVQS